MRAFIIFVLLCGSLISVEQTRELQQFVASVSKDSALQSFLKKFPLQNYTDVTVPGLGDFYLDDIHDNIKENLRKGKYWESEIGKILIEHTKPGSVAVDIGAHIGIHTIAFSRCVGASGYVVSLEPQKKIFREQYYNLKLNACKNVVQLPYCAGEKMGVVEIVGWSGEGVNEGGAAIGKGGDKVLMIPIDALKLQNVSCIKMDVESYELQVLQGCEETLKKNKPVLVFEILGNHDLDTCTGAVKEHYDSTINFLQNLGYQVTRIAKTNDFIAEPI